MVDAIVSVVAERITALLEEQGRHHVNLVRGAAKEASSVAKELRTVRAVLDDAERRGFEEQSVKDWLSRLQQASADMDGVLDEWKYAILKLQVENYQSEGGIVAPLNQKVCSFITSPSCFSFKKGVRSDIAKKILNVKERLDEILKEKDRFGFVMSEPTSDLIPSSSRDPSTSLTDLSRIVGRDSERDFLVGKLTGRQEELGFQVVSIVGVGGLGKTTLAQLVYNDGLVVKSFDIRIWVCVSGPFDFVFIAIGILESVRKGSSSNITQLNVLLRAVQENISGKRFLLVLDDVWSVHNSLMLQFLINSLDRGGAGSKVLVTTRNQNVAEDMYTMDDDIYHPKMLSDEDCWLLLRRIALSGKKGVRFEEIGRRIASKCGGLPLSAKVLGGLLHSKSRLEDWGNVLNSEIWQLEIAEVELFPHLLLSYNTLSPVLKRCFLYCAVFPKDSEISVEDLIGYWMALGYLGSDTCDMELKGQQCFEILAMHSLFHDFQIDFDGQIRSCKMHDMVHDFAQYLRRSGRVEAAVLNNFTCETCDISPTSPANERCRLSFGYSNAPPYLCGCLEHLRVLNVMSQSLPRGIENMIRLRWLNLHGINLSCEDLKIIFQLYNLQTLKIRFCKIEEIPREIGCLIQLRRLDLSHNWDLKELPESMCSLKELRTLNVENCPRLTFGINGLRNLGLWKNMNLLNGTVRLKIRLGDDNLEDVIRSAQDAKLSEKRGIERLVLEFEDEMKKGEGRLGLIDALEPPPILQELSILSYKGTQLPAWIGGTALNRLWKIHIINCDYISSLLPLAKLPCLKEIEIISLYGLRSVGREFLGITTTVGGGGDVDIQSASNTIVAFPKLKKLTFRRCPNWKEWEDITAEEEESADVVLMPCLTDLELKICTGLTELPHRLLRKVSSLKVLDLSYSEKLQQRYRDKDISVFRNPHLQIKWTS